MAYRVRLLGESVEIEEAEASPNQCVETGKAVVRILDGEAVIVASESLSATRHYVIDAIRGGIQWFSYGDTL